MSLDARPRLREKALRSELRNLYVNSLWRILWAGVLAKPKRSRLRAAAPVRMSHDYNPEKQAAITSIARSIALLVGSCHHRLEQPPISVGASSFAFVELPPVKTAVPPTDGPAFESAIEVDPDYLVAAKPIEPLLMPLYPPAALSGKAGFVTVGVRVTIDADGDVVEAGPSPLADSTPGRYSAAFQNAVRTAVMQWRFRPAEHYTMKTTQPDEGGGTEKILHREYTATYLDLAFTFTAAGKVLPETLSK